jgi:hypothetical protein
MGVVVVDGHRAAAAVMVVVASSKKGLGEVTAGVVLVLLPALATTSTSSLFTNTNALASSNALATLRGLWYSISMGVLNWVDDSFASLSSQYASCPSSRC